MVTEVRVDAILVRMFGQRPEEASTVPGRTEVTFRLGDSVSFEVDWTELGDVPSPGDQWTLVLEPPALAKDQT